MVVWRRRRRRKAGPIRATEPLSFSSPFFLSFFPPFFLSFPNVKNDCCSAFLVARFLPLLFPPLEGKKSDCAMLKKHIIDMNKSVL